MGVKRVALWAPLVIFALVFVVVISGLVKPGETVVRSAMVGKPVPDFALPAMVAGKPGLSAATFRQGQPRLLNVFASWCVPCIAEAPQLLRLKAAGVPIDAIAVRDTGTAITSFLARNGDPYARIGSDSASRVQMALGSSGVPETFVVDGRGIVVKQIIGDIRPEQVDEIVQAVRAAR